MKKAENISLNQSTRKFYKIYRGSNFECQYKIEGYRINLQSLQLVPLILDSESTWVSEFTVAHLPTPEIAQVVDQIMHFNFILSSLFLYKRSPHHLIEIIFTYIF